MPSTTNQPHSWAWIPTIYFAQGLPYIIVMSVAVIMFFKLGISNAEIAFYTSWLNLPWIIKPLWSPLVELLKTKRWWILAMQLLIGAIIAKIAMTIEAPDPFRYCIGLMFLLAFSSATHDIATDGFYLISLDEKRQAGYIGIRNTFYRLAVIFGQGLLVMLAGQFEIYYQQQLPAIEAIPKAWAIVFYLLAGIFLLLFIYHWFILPRPATDTCRPKGDKRPAGSISREFFMVFADFFRKKEIVPALSFILLYRFAEAQLVKIASPFLLDTAGAGGLGLSTTEVGFIYGTVGVIALTTGGIIGGLVIARNGLKHWLWWMTAAMNVPNIVYLYLSIAHPTNMVLISSCVAVEQLGYGFGFTSLTFFMMIFSKGKHQTTHYAICTGFMALGMMLPGMVSGLIQEYIGYQNFFIWVMICTIPSFIATRYIHIGE